MSAEAPLFPGFQPRDLHTSRGLDPRRRRRQRAAGAAAARLPADAPDVARRRPAARGAPHRGRDRPRRLRRVVPARARDDHAAVRQAGDGPRPGGGHGRARLRAFAVAGHDRGGRVAYRMALDHPDRVRAPRGARHRPHRGGVGAGRPATSPAATGTGRSSPSPRRCPSAHRRRPQAYFDVHVRAGMGLGATRPLPAEILAATGARSTTPPRSRRCARTTARARRRRRARRGRPGGPPDRVPGARPVGAHGGARRASTATCSTSGGRGPPTCAARAVDAKHFVAEDRPEETAAARCSAFLAVP